MYVLLFGVHDIETARRAAHDRREHVGVAASVVLEDVPSIGTIRVRGGGAGGGRGRGGKGGKGSCITFLAETILISMLSDARGVRMDLVSPLPSSIFQCRLPQRGSKQRKS
jgi:hypothetical protein